MEIELGPDDVAFRDELRAFVNANRDALGDQTAWHQRLVDGNWAVPGWPTAWGGRDATLTQEVVYNQVLADNDAPIVRNAIGLFNIGPMLLQFGTDEQQHRYLPPMVRAVEIWCQGFSEPEAGSDLAALQTRATDAGDHWVVDGRKVWTTYAHDSALCLALVRTDPESSPHGAGKHRGISALIIDMEQPGVEVRPLREITGEEGFNEIVFDGAIVGKDRLVGELHQGWRVAMSTLTFERLGTMKLGIQLSKHLDELVALARSLGKDRDPLVRQRLGYLGTQVDLMQLLTESALSALQQGRDPGIALPLGKMQWSYLMQEVAESGMQLQGPDGVLYRDDRSIDGDWQYHTLYNRMTTIGAGTTEVQKNIMAYRTLGLPRDPRQETKPADLSGPDPADEMLASLRHTVRRFLDDRCPVTWVRERIDEGGATTDAVYKEMADLGLTGALIPEQHGGLGLGYEAAGVLLGELGRALHPAPLTDTALAAVTALLQIGDDDDHARWLPAISDGSATAGLALLDRGFGWDLGAPGTAAVEDGDGWSLSGTKRFVPAGTDVLFVTARAGDDLGLFAVTSDPQRTRLSTLDQTRPVDEVVFDATPAVRVGGNARAALGRVVDRILAGTILETAAAAARVTEIANEYAKVRVQFDVPIGSFQAVQHLLADMLRAVELARTAAGAALRAADRGDDEACHRAAVMAATHATEALPKVTADAIQVLGGIGFTWEHDAHLYYRRALTLPHLFGGTTEFREAYARLLLA